MEEEECASRSKTLCEGPHVRQAGYRTAVKKVATPVGRGLVQVGSKVLNTGDGLYYMGLQLLGLIVLGTEQQKLRSWKSAADHRRLLC
jgi:hypothetical protein